MTEHQTPFSGPQGAADGKTAHSALIARLESLTGPDRDVDAAICREVMGWTFHREVINSPWHECHWWAAPGTTEPIPTAPRFTESLDAVLKHLLPEGVNWKLVFYNGVPTASVARSAVFGNEEPANPAIALTIACMRARMEGL